MLLAFGRKFTNELLCKSLRKASAGRCLLLSKLHHGDDDLEDSDVKSILKETFSDVADKKRVFIIQPRMQYKSKARQSMSAELQLDESVGLISTLNNWDIAGTSITSTKTINKKTIWGSGNIETLAKKVSTSGANCIFIGVDRLTNTQREAIRSELASTSSMQIYDRYMIVLRIFKANARTTIAKLQIALADLHYKRYKMGDKEIFQDWEKKIKSELERQGKKRELLNQGRRKLNIPLVSVIGYTNNGKTSLIKYLTNDENIKPKNSLFATLDVTYHGMKLPTSSMNVILIDTIGFISDIPYDLIDAFKVTLADALESDLLIHVVDATHPDHVAQERVVLEILSELNVDEAKIANMITVYNKYDKLKDKVGIDELCASSESQRVALSCKTGFGMPTLLELVEKKLIKIRNYLQLTLKIAQGSEEMRYLYKNCIIKETRVLEEDHQFVLMDILFDKVNAIKFMKRFPSIKVVKKNDH